MTYNPAHSGMLIMILALAGVALGKIVNAWQVLLRGARDASCEEKAGRLKEAAQFIYRHKAKIKRPCRRTFPVCSDAWKSHSGVAANGGKINRKQAQRSVFPANGGVLTLKEICPA